MKTFFNSLGMISSPLVIIFFALKPIVKKLLGIEIVIFLICSHSKALMEKHHSQEVASNKLEKGPLRDYKTVCFLFTSDTGEKDF
jgi:hypothetical protein